MSIPLIQMVLRFRFSMFCGKKCEEYESFLWNHDPKLHKFKCLKCLSRTLRAIWKALSLGHEAAEGCQGRQWRGG